MIQQTPVRAYKMRPMFSDVKHKVECSYRETIGLNERELCCPYCSWYIASLFSDASGHLKARCKNCKTITTFNLGYF